MQLRVNIPPLTRVLLALTLVISLAYQVVRIELWATKRSPNFLALIPQWSLFYPWVYFTATFAEQNIFTLIIAGLTIFFGGRYMERAWGSREFGKFVLLVILVPNFAAALLYVLWFAMTKEDEQAWATIQGSVALEGAFLVAFKQLVPEHTVTILKGFIRIRVKHFPAIFLAANTISGVVLGTDTALVLAWLGFMTSWTYLRFYKKQSDLTSASTGNNGIRGDASETFAFASFWPDAVQPPIAVIASSVYHALVVLKICTPFSAEEVEWGNQQAMARGEGGLPSLLNADGRRGGAGKREEAERRRALALRALDQKLYATTANRPTAPQTATASHTADPVTSEGADGGVEMTGDSH
ncbi:MAG: hypothetical protein Q9191_000336 [Dirinaria sp. TL-2023a]